MGKRKSKVSKQKQAKAAASSHSIKNRTNKETSFGGVRITKGGKNVNASGDVLMVHDNNNGDRKNKNIKAKLIIAKKNKKLKQIFGKDFKAPPSSSQKGDSMDEEQKEFERQYASMQERQYHRNLKKNSSKKNKKTNFQFSPATFQKGPVTAEEMVQDAAERVAFGMKDIGQQVLQPMQQEITASSIGGSSNLLQVMAARKREEWILNQQNQQQEQQNRLNKTNEENNFAILHSDSDDEEEKIKKEPVLSFQFAPASFSFQQNNKILAPLSQKTTFIDDDDL